MDTIQDNVVITEASGIDLFHAFTLVVETYMQEGLLPSSPSNEDIEGHLRLFNQFFSRESQKTTLVAKAGSKVVGTISYYSGGPFPIEDDFPKELAELRNENVPLTYLGLFAVAENFREQSLGVDLMKEVKLRFALRGKINTVCVVNRHHVKAHQRERFYEVAEASKPLPGMRECAKAILLLRRQHACGTAEKK